jgi:hypothetical protein
VWKLGSFGSPLILPSGSDTLSFMHRCVKLIKLMESMSFSILILDTSYEVALHSSIQKL